MVRRNIAVLESRWIQTFCLASQEKTGQRACRVHKKGTRRVTTACVRPSAQRNFSERLFLPSRNFHIAFLRGSTFRFRGERRRGQDPPCPRYVNVPERSSLPPRRNYHWFVSCHRFPGTYSYPSIDLSVDRRSSINRNSPSLIGHSKSFTIIFFHENLNPKYLLYQPRLFTKPPNTYSCYSFSRQRTSSINEAVHRAVY